MRGRVLASVTGGLATLCAADGALAAGHDSPIGKELSLLWVIPFAVMLLAIAVLPLATEKWWHPNRNKLIVSAILGLPVIGLFLYMDHHAVLHTGEEYISFIILLGALFVISGGIVVQTDLRATPLVNTGFLALGSVLASFMGTTGAAMLLIRPLLETNSQRTKTIHTVIFFTFLVANIGGCLTPLGDPPLFMGYLKGIPFEWTFGLIPEWGAVVGVLLVIYFVIDTLMYTREPLAALEADKLEIKPTRIVGAWLNVPLLAGVVLSVAFLNENYLPFKAFPLRESALIALALVSWFGTRREYRQLNKFTFYPIVEVAVLFAGIFATMIPAILILNARGAELGVDSPASFFWATGSLSSFLDNTPTYVVFFALAQSLPIADGGVDVAGTGVELSLLRAISLGAVFMGAMTYIGNAPNFMVKSIAEERKLKMPSFFGYMLWSIAILIPVFIGVTFLFL
ncbi:MAG: sodium:proton antiporter [Deltaproteobacteria bacterium]|nr:sodium:proton antiporter [Deltaproteobacteria bacterium]